MGKRIHIVAAGIWLCSLACYAQQPELRGKVALPDGTPATQATVYVLRFDLGLRKQVVAGEGQTNDRGLFFLRPGSAPEQAALRTFTALIGWQPGFAIGVVWGEPWPENLVITLAESHELKGRVLDAQGKPVKDAKLSPMWIRAKPGAVMDTLSFPDVLRQKWALRTGEGGEFTFNLMARDGSVCFLLEAPGFARQQVASVALARDWIITLYRPSRVRGRVSCADPKAKLSGLTARYDVRMKSGFAWDATTTDAEGKFQWENVPPGDVGVRLVTGPESEWQTAGEHEFRLAEGENKEDVVVELKRATRISGQVAESGTREPISGAGIHASEDGSLPGPPVGTTDGEGRYSFYALPGKLTVSAMPPVPGYEAGSAAKAAIVVGAEPVAVPSLLLTNRMTVEGIVVDERGSPASGAEVFSVEPLVHAAATSDGQGQFRLSNLSPDSAVTVRARTKTALSEPVTFVPKSQKGPVKLVLKPSGWARVRGRVIDREGKPVARADVQVWLRTHDSASRGPAGQTDRNGGFESEPLSPGQSYCLTISADGYAPASTKAARAEAATGHDFGDIVLRSASGFLAGRVVDSQGNPMAGVRVWNAGEAFRVVETKSGRDGAFRLDGLLEGYAHAFAEKGGHRVAGLCAKTDSRDLILTLYRKDEKPPAPPLSPSGDVDRATAERLVRKFVDMGLTQAGDEKDARRADERRATLAGLLARIDPARAKSLSDRNGGKYDTEIAVALAKEAVKRDVSESIAYLAGIASTAKKARVLLSMAREAARRDVERARALIRHALPAVRAVEPVHERTELLAELGRLMVELSATGGREIVDECVAKARDFPLTGRDAHYRGLVAEQVCEVDPKAALDLLRPVTDEDERGRHLDDVLCRIAGKLPDQAEALVRETEAAHLQERALAALCVSLAKTDLARAERIADSIESRDEKSLSLCSMAKRIADTNRPKALELLDKAVAMQEDAADRRAPYLGYHRAPPTGIAVIARAAAELGHPEAHWMLRRALSLRVVREWSRDNPSARRYDTGLAIAIAATDTRMGRDFVQTLIPQVAPMGSPLFESSLLEPASELAFAALLADPALCEQVLEQLSRAGIPFETERLVEYLLADARQRRTLVNLALDIEPADEDF